MRCEAPQTCTSRHLSCQSVGCDALRGSEAVGDHRIHVLKHDTLHFVRDWSQLARVLRIGYLNATLDTLVGYA